jgi:hypothetical protein
MGGVVSRNGVTMVAKQGLGLLQELIVFTAVGFVTLDTAVTVGHIRIRRRVFVKERTALVGMAVPAGIVKAVGSVLIGTTREAVTTQTGHIALLYRMGRAARELGLVGLVAVPTEFRIAVNQERSGIVVNLVTGTAVGLQIGVDVTTIVVEIPVRGVAFGACLNRILSDKPARIGDIADFRIIQVLVPPGMARDARDRHGRFGHR